MLPSSCPIFVAQRTGDPANADVVEALRGEFEDLVFVHELDGTPGSDWTAELGDAVGAARFVVVLIAKDGLGPIQTKEASLAISAVDAPVILPVLQPGVRGGPVSEIMADAALVPPFLRTLNPIDYREKDGKALGKLVARIAEDLSTAPAPAPAPRPASGKRRLFGGAMIAAAAVLGFTFVPGRPVADQRPRPVAAVETDLSIEGPARAHPVAGLTWVGQDGRVIQVAGDEFSEVRLPDLVHPTGQRREPGAFVDCFDVAGRPRVVTRNGIYHFTPDGRLFNSTIVTRGVRAAIAYGDRILVLTELYLHVLSDQGHEFGYLSAELPPSLRLSSLESERVGLAATDAVWVFRRPSRTVGLAGQPLLYRLNEGTAELDQVDLDQVAWPFELWAAQGTAWLRTVAGLFRLSAESSVPIPHQRIRSCVTNIIGLGREVLVEEAHFDPPLGSRPAEAGEPGGERTDERSIVGFTHYLLGQGGACTTIDLGGRAIERVFEADDRHWIRTGGSHLVYTLGGGQVRPHALEGSLEDVEATGRHTWFLTSAGLFVDQGSGIPVRVALHVTDIFLVGDELAVLIGGALHWWTHDELELDELVPPGIVDVVEGAPEVLLRYLDRPAWILRQRG